MTLNAKYNFMEGGGMHDREATNGLHAPGMSVEGTPTASQGLKYPPKQMGYSSVAFTFDAYRYLFTNDQQF